MNQHDRLICLSLVLMSIGGAVIASYLTSVHYAAVPLACSDNGVIDCQRVLTSIYSEVFGIPWSVGGIIWFAISGLIAMLALSRRLDADALHLAQAGWSLLGIAVVFYLIGVELIGVKHICIWCTSMHLLIVLMLVLVLFRHPEEVEPGPESIADGRAKLRRRSGDRA